MTLLVKVEYGSTVYGTATPDSDVDYICIHSDECSFEPQILSRECDINNYSHSNFQRLLNIVNAERERLNKISESMSDSRDIHCSPDDYCEFCSEGACVNCGTNPFVVCTHDWYDRHFEIKR